MFQLLYDRTSPAPFIAIFSRLFCNARTQNEIHRFFTCLGYRQACRNAGHQVAMAPRIFFHLYYYQYVIQQRLQSSFLFMIHFLSLSPPFYSYCFAVIFLYVPPSFLSPFHPPSPSLKTYQSSASFYSFSTFITFLDFFIIIFPFDLFILLPFLFPYPRNIWIVWGLPHILMDNRSTALCLP